MGNRETADVAQRAARGQHLLLWDEVVAMMRAVFFAVGLFVTLWGGGLLVVDKFVLNVKADAPAQAGFRGLFTAITPERKQVIDPPEWAAFSLISVGTVTMLYAVALPKKPAG